MTTTNRPHAIALAVLAMAAAVTGAEAGVILQDTSTASIQVNAFEPIGQSFVAEDSSIKFAFNYQTFNSSFPNDPLELKLVSGDGTGGAVLATVSFSLADNFDGFWDIDFSSVSLTVGNVYTAVLSVPGTSPYFAVRVNNNGNPYAGGRAYWTGDSLTNDASDDTRFRVTPNEATDVPEPGTLSLAALAVAGLWASRRRAVAPTRAT